MQLAPGTRLGPYEIVAPLGAGGMGEVYRAKDTKLNRDVAIKVLPESFAPDADRVARFTREAQVLASLNHPNIAAIYGIEEQGSTRALVMELVEGEDLSAVIARGALSLADALPIAKQIADALEVAHEQGIVHRDLKPQNIKVRADGTVKVLDFGLAKAIDPATSSSSNLANSPTMTSPAMTGMGMILGTAAYMSPEQAKGRAVDKRADIWAFGVVLYEILAGRRAFEGEDVSDLLVAVLSKDVDLASLPGATPPAIVSLIRRCLERDPKARLRDIGEARVLLSNPQSMSASPPSAPARAVASRTPWVIAAGLAVVAAVAVWGWMHPPAPPARTVTRASIVLPQSLDTANDVAISRDGKRFAYWEQTREGAQHIVVRDLDQSDGRVVAGTEGGDFPGFSPDGEWLAFATAEPQNRQLLKVRVSGGTPVTVCAMPDQGVATSISWDAADTILFASRAGVHRVAAAGGVPQAVTALDATNEALKEVIEHQRPQQLPGGQAVLFTARARSAAASAVAVFDTTTRTHRVVVQGALGGRYVPTGHLVYVRGGTLFVAPFDLRRMAVTGAETPAIDNLQSVDYAFSDTGILVFTPGFRGQAFRLEWLDRQGGTHPLEGPARRWDGVRLSPDGQSVVGSVIVPLPGGQGRGTADLYRYDLARGTVIRLTTAGYYLFPEWSRDGQWITSTSGLDGPGPSEIVRVPAFSGGPPEIVVGRENGVRVLGGEWAPDGSFLYRRVVEGKGKSALWLRPAPGTPGGPAPRHFSTFETRAISDFELSPDGKTLAYTVSESDQTDVFVVPFPGPGPRVQISTSGGSWPRWSRSGQEIYYVGPAASGAARLQLMSVNMASTPPGRPQVVGPLTWPQFDVGPDNRRFLTLGSEGDDPVLNQFVVITNWFEDLRSKMGAAK